MAPQVVHFDREPVPTTRVLTAIGGAAGIGLSVGGSSIIARVLGWPIAIPAQSLVVATAFSIRIGLVFGFFPARRAAALDPIEALRKEG